MRTGGIDDTASILRLIRSMKGLPTKDLKSRLNFPAGLVNYHLSVLVAKNLAEFVDNMEKGHEIIRITDRGTKFLELYEAIRAKYLPSTIPDG